VELHCYYSFSSTDRVSERLRKAAAGWHDISALGDAQAAHLIRKDGIDILVDLAGHTSHNRLGIFARKPAPVQASWLGYFNTTGLPAMDYFLSDPHSSPPGQETFFTEALLRLPRTRFCYEPWEWTPEVNELPALSSGAVTFGSLNNLAKLNEGVLALWSRLLAAVPGSRLLIQAQALDDEPNRARFAALAARAGMDPARLELRPFAPLEQAMHAYHRIDIALDPFPFCGGMTSFEALWMGVPVVTLEQPMIAGRQTLSMLRNLQLDELVADSEARYLGIAAALAVDLPRLAELRRGLRPRFAASPLADYAGQARALEGALRAMWRDWARLPPR
jgi:predicted O-linked N-acetylglucosamine transferase (SPINDLY family)